MVDPIPSKTCTRCGAEKSPTEFHVRAKAADGLNAACKVCICAARRAHTAKNPDKLAEYRKRYDAEHRDEKIARTKAWRAQNVEHRREYAREYDRANAEQRAAAKRAWWKENQERLAERLRTDPILREQRRLTLARYRERNRGVVTERQRQRRVDRLGLTIEQVDLDALWTGSCGLCDGQIDPDIQWPDPFSKSIDHIIPLIHGGTHESHNLQWAHLRCNISKGARLPDTA